MFCYLWTDKKTDGPYIMLVEGKFIRKKGSQLVENTLAIPKGTLINPATVKKDLKHFT